MAATTPQAWSSLFDDTPNASPTSRLYTEEAIQNDNLTADEIVEKADSNSSLLVEIVSALNLDHETLLSFGDNDLIQTLHRECQEMADYLSARIWHDSGLYNTNNRLFGASSSSSSSSSAYPGHYGKTLVEEAQIAAFISSSEKIQVAFMRFDETRDYLQARELQREEENQLRAMYQMRKDILPHPYLDDVDDYATNSSFNRILEDLPDDTEDEPSSSSHEKYVYSDGRVRFSRAAIETRRQHGRKSEEPLIWQLDPREDFKVNKMKMKKKVDQIEIDRIYKERLLEKGPSNSLHGLTPQMTITPDMLADSDDDEEENNDADTGNLDQYLQQGGAGTSHAAAGEVKAAKDTTIAEDEDEEEILEGVERINNRALNPLPVDDDTDGEDDGDEDGVNEEDEAGILSDDSWEEIPRQEPTNSSVQEVTRRLGEASVDEDGLSTSSSTSSFLLTTDAASTPNP